MYRTYQSDYPNQVHQLLVTVSKHFQLGAKDQLKHQKKSLDISLKNLERSTKHHVIHYFLRDHFTGAYHAEMCSSNNLIPVKDFLLRSWLPKVTSPFRGIPEYLMVPKTVESYFPQLVEFLSELGIEKIYPPSGFASGPVRDVPVWEEHIRAIVVIKATYDDMLFPIQNWNPRVTDRIAAYLCEEKLNIWQHSIPEVLILKDDYVRRTASNDFKSVTEFPDIKSIGFGAE
jgi:hypothetical protein